MAGLYLHIPFCHSKCVYCDFYSRPCGPKAGAGEAARVVDGLIAEFEARREEVSAPFTTVYVGGGTPSVVPAELLARLFRALPLGEASEVTLEANPEDVTPEAVAAWRDSGVNRVSMGVQALDDALLRRMGRRHSSRRALEAIDHIYKGGITNISADLIYGLPGMTPAEWADGLKRLLDTPISHLSAYCLTYHEGTALYRRLKEGRVIPADDEDIELQFNALRRISAESGFEHYEISNLAKPGFRSAHNSAYWNPASQWLGIGPSAHSFDGRVRRVDFADTSRWLASLPYPFEIEEETPLDLVNDTIVTSLRTLEGLDLRDIPAEHRGTLMRAAAPFIASGDMTSGHDGLSLAINPDRWLISDRFIRELIIA